MARYVEPRAARHRVEIVDGSERLRIPARHNWALAALLLLWLAVWTVGGVAGAAQLFSSFQPFMLLAAAVWLAGAAAAVSLIGSAVAGTERVRVVDGDLEISAGVGPMRRTWRYRGSAIRNLCRAEHVLPWVSYGTPLPVYFRPQTGAVRFDYGADTVHFAASVAGAEGGMIVDWLAQRLPASAVPPAAVASRAGELLPAFAHS